MGRNDIIDELRLSTYLATAVACAISFLTGILTAYLIWGPR